MNKSGFFRISKFITFAALGLCVLLLFVSCASDKTPEVTDMTYHQISQEEAMEMMEKNDGHIIVDVRREDEYFEGHIPGAVLIPNESIENEMPKELPDLDQIILIYCRSGNRSKQAAEKLAKMGYTNLYEFGGITTWQGDIETGDPIYPSYPSECVLAIKVNGQFLYANFADNASAKALQEKLEKGEINLKLREYGGFEKVGSLPWSLERSDEQMTTKPGYLVLYQGDQLCLHYGSNSWSYTLLAYIPSANANELKSILGDGDVKVTLSLDWLDY